MYYLPYATSLRLSDLGYTNKSQSNLGITFNELHEYVAGLKRAIKTPSEEYAKMGCVEKEAEGNWLQLNSNVLQIENELYAPIRPKRVTQSRGETPSDALLRGGIEYIEVRSLDINPFSPIGVDAEQARFLDLFLVWCALADAPEMSSRRTAVHPHKLEPRDSGRAQAGSDDRHRLGQRNGTVPADESRQGAVRRSASGGGSTG